MRQSVLGTGDVEAMWALTEAPDGAGDVELLERLLHALPDRDPRHAVLQARLDAAAL